MQFMVDCAVMLNHRMVLGVSQRNLRVQKYRGSAFNENESPFVISKTGYQKVPVGRIDDVECLARRDRAWVFQQRDGSDVFAPAELIGNPFAGFARVIQIIKNSLLFSACSIARHLPGIG